MTAAESCTLLVSTVRELSAANDEIAAYRLLLSVALQHAHDQHVELERMRVRYYALLDERRASRPAA